MRFAPSAWHGASPPESEETHVPKHFLPSSPGLVMAVEGGKAKMQRLFPVKEEFVVGGLAIGSVNYHRNFFGERCGILAGEDTAHTSCLAFGLERWVHVLTDRFGSADAAAAAVESLH